LRWKIGENFSLFGVKDPEEFMKFLAKMRKPKLAHKNTIVVPVGVFQVKIFNSRFRKQNILVFSQQVLKYLQITFVLASIFGFETFCESLHVKSPKDTVGKSKNFAIEISGYSEKSANLCATFAINKEVFVSNLTTCRSGV
jgi:hypothetical protein